MQCPSAFVPHPLCPTHPPTTHTAPTTTVGLLGDGFPYLLELARKRVVQLGATVVPAGATLYCMGLEVATEKVAGFDLSGMNAYRCTVRLDLLLPAELWVCKPVGVFGVCGLSCWLHQGYLPHSTPPPPSPHRNANCLLPPHTLLPAGGTPPTKLCIWGTSPTAASPSLPRSSSSSSAGSPTKPGAGGLSLLQLLGCQKPDDAVAAGACWGLHRS